MTTRKFQDTGVAVYFGAMDDMFFLSHATLMSQANHFVCIDGLPDSKYFLPEEAGYARTCDEPTFLATIDKSIYKHVDYFDIVQVQYNRPNHVRYTILPAGSPSISIVVDYFYNTLVEQAITSPEILALLERADLLIEKGFNPFLSGLCMHHVPNLQREYSDDGDEEIYDRRYWHEDFKCRCTK